MTGSLTRLWDLLHNVVLVVRTAVQHAGEDPLLLVVQMARRLPSPARRAIGRVLYTGSAPPGLRTAFAHFITDHPAVAAQHLRQARHPRRKLTTTLSAELAVQLGEPVDRPKGKSTPPLPAAHAAWNTGDIDQAINVALGAGSRAGTRYARRVASERETMRPEFILPAPRSSRLHRRTPHLARTEGVRVLHILTNSVPPTHSGYVIRSHEVLRAQQAARIAVAAVTRLGYPVTVGEVGAAKVDVVDDITYHSCWPPDSLPYQCPDCGRWPTSPCRSWQSSVRRCCTPPPTTPTSRGVKGDDADAVATAQPLLCPGGRCAAAALVRPGPAPAQRRRADRRGSTIATLSARTCE